MNKFKMIPYKLDHFDLLEIREREVQSMNIIGRAKERMEVLAQTGNCFTMIYSGKIIGVMGWFEHWPEVCELFVLPTIYLSEAGFIFARTMKRYLHSFEKVRNFRRVQVTAVKDILHNRWLSWLGFVIEGTLKKYGPNGEDFIMWARYKEDGN